MTDEQQKKQKQSANQRENDVLDAIRREMRSRETIDETVHRERVQYEQEHRGKGKRA